MDLRTSVSLARLTAVGVCVIGLAAMTGCGSSDGKYSEADLQAARKEAATQQHMKDIQRQQAKDQQRLEAELAALKKKGSSSSGGSSSSSGGSSSGGSSSGGSSSGGSSGGSAGTTSCGGGVSISGPTTCGFAQNVADAYRASGPGDVVAYSPTTGKRYIMNCSSAGVCSGGTTSGGATVYVP